MLKRTITGIGITIVVYLVLWFSHLPRVLPCTLLVLNIFSVYELFHAARLETETRPLLFTVIGVCLISLVPIPSYESIMLAIFPVAVVIFLWIMLRQENCILDVPIRMCGLCLLVAALFRSIPEVRKLEYGFYYLTLAVTLCFVTDIMAYLVGKTIGRYKLCPKISPNKTVEGSIGGIVGAVAVMVGIAVLLERSGLAAVSMPMLIVYTVLTAVVGEFGDLAMSGVKRVCGIKDFSNLFPGHGGILDRFDSHLFAIAFTLAFCTLTGGYLC